MLSFYIGNIKIILKICDFCVKNFPLENYNTFLNIYLDFSSIKLLHFSTKTQKSPYRYKLFCVETNSFYVSLLPKFCQSPFRITNFCPLGFIIISSPSAHNPWRYSLSYLRLAIVMLIRFATISEKTIAIAVTKITAVLFIGLASFLYF